MWQKLHIIFFLSIVFDYIVQDKSISRNIDVITVFERLEHWSLIPRKFRGNATEQINFDDEVSLIHFTVLILLRSPVFKIL